MFALKLKSRRASASKQQITIDRAENSSRQLESRSRAHGITEKKTGELLFFFRRSVLPVCVGPRFKRQGNVYCESDERENPQMHHVSSQVQRQTGKGAVLSFPVTSI